jgi:hypothetical protein
MALDVSGLTDYVNQNSQELLTALHYEGTSYKYMTPLAGVKDKENLQLFALTAYPQATAGGCDVVASGSATFTKREMNVEKIAYRDEICLDDLTPKWTQMLLAPGAAGEDEITAQLANDMNAELKALIMENNEIADWQGNTASGDAVLRQYDGLIKIIDAASDEVLANTTNAALGWTTITAGTGITTANVISIVKVMVRAQPEKLKRQTGKYLFAGTDVFDLYVQALEAANLFHLDATTDLSSYEIRVPGTNIIMVGVAGLTGTSRLFLAQKRNLFYGFDLASDTDSIVWKVLESDKMRYTAKLKRGMQVAYPSEVVSFKLT